MIKLARELDYNLVLENAHEGWLVADELADAKVSVVLTPRARRRASPGREDSSGSSTATAFIRRLSAKPRRTTPRARRTPQTRSVSEGRNSSLAYAFFWSQNQPSGRGPLYTRWSWRRRELQRRLERCRELVPGRLVGG